MQRRTRPRATTPEPRAGRPLIAFGRWWWAGPALLAVLLVQYAATLAGTFFAFTDYSGVGTFTLTGLDNFVAIFQDPSVLGVIGNTLLYAVAQMVGTTILGLAFALALHRGLKSRYVLRAIVFLPIALSPLAVSYVWKFVFEYDGLLNQALGALGLEQFQRTWLGDPETAIWTVVTVIIWQGVGISMVIFLAGLSRIPAELEEAASLDRANLWQRFRYVTLPALRPSVTVATMLSLIFGLRLFDPILALTGGGPVSSSKNLALLVYEQAFTQGNFGYGAALSLILTVIILIFAIIQQLITRERPGD
ncbi:sugar ABC transporter permease [Cnuibacter physcomitrellae]|uniref:Sugar ABC transporter permease n=1 Tax=Cnuibacter physcomitrellae TaxID=1619308 RepID=A0A1X9LG87_9MICO|nr:sugar ABC transporter permease [Cnuibacter physcomitrellae]ARJ04194.1 sugar ABC transporter permease [Cnuibacter physcomitrellae]GGI40474.1 sugar ABC transporter permease [Cnuibacter physcomitrellae]